MEWAPDQLIGHSRFMAATVGWPYGSSDAAPEEETFRDYVRCIKAADTQRDDIVESRGRAEIDQTDEAGN